MADPTSGNGTSIFWTSRPGRIQPSAVRGLEFYIFDKKAGPFELELEKVEAIRKR